jgi:two-component system nitrate/nitrite response regulator NarL
LIALDDVAVLASEPAALGTREMLIRAEPRLQGMPPSPQGITAFREPRVLLISPSPLEREALCLVLERGGFPTQVAAYDIEAVKAAAPAAPDIVIVDVANEPVLADSLWFMELRRLLPAAHIVLLSDRLNPEWLMVCRETNLAGYLSKASTGPAVYQQLRLILEGERILPLKILREMVSSAADAAGSRDRKRSQTLSQRDREVLRLLVAGQSNKTIAERLQLGESTVKVVLKSIFAKIRVTNRTEAALWALNHGLDNALISGEAETPNTMT